ncbi:KDM2A [Branchiostoma lanceolatum]|uniref:KDM2A protein n=1 Tax=Branchiostoma lanceolatum TaxID=7740 RepID=A0A8J9VLV5_BRALA|nr:KDM2A [Branchiostoma lanceolatum]
MRAKPPKHYDDEEEIEDEIEGKRTFSVEEKLKSDRFTEDFVEYKDGTDFGLKYLQKNGFHNPICIKNKEGLGIRIPGQEFNVNDVRQFVDVRRLAPSVACVAVGCGCVVMIDVSRMRHGAEPVRAVAIEHPVPLNPCMPIPIDTIEPETPLGDR